MVRIVQADADHFGRIGDRRGQERIADGNSAFDLIDFERARQSS